MNEYVLLILILLMLVIGYCFTPTYRKTQQKRFLLGYGFCFTLVIPLSIIWYAIVNFIDTGENFLLLCLFSLFPHMLRWRVIKRYEQSQEKELEKGFGDNYKKGTGINWFGVFLTFGNTVTVILAAIGIFKDDRFIEFAFFFVIGFIFIVIGILVYYWNESIKLERKYNKKVLSYKNKMKEMDEEYKNSIKNINNINNINNT